MRNIARSLPFLWTPQETSRMLLKMEKDVNASLQSRETQCSRTFLVPKEFGRQGKKEMQQALALGVSCGRLAAFTALLFRIQGCTRCRSEEGRESYSGGRATWASFYSWSSG
jgi:hypothetical protein